MTELKFINRDKVQVSCKECGTLDIVSVNDVCMSNSNGWQLDNGWEMCPDGCCIICIECWNKLKEDE